MTNPWRPQDIGDAILHRKSYDGPQIENPQWVDISALEVEADEIYAMLQPRNLVLWPMILHRHGQECRRA